MRKYWNLYDKLQHYFYYLTDKNYRFIVNNKFYFSFFFEPVITMPAHFKTVLPNIKRTLYYNADLNDKLISFHFISMSDDLRGWIKDLFEYKYLESSKKIMIDGFVLSNDKSKFIIQNFSENFIELKQVEKRIRKLNKVK